MKALNLQMEEQYHDDLETVRSFFSEEQGIRFNKSMAMKKILHECATRIKENGSIWPGESGPKGG